MSVVSRDRWLWAILAFAILLRLIGLNEPLIDQQAWRQTDTAAIARNFSEEGYELFHPRVDWRGDTAGYVEMNFPLFPYLTALVYGVAGESHEWIGRLLAAICSTLSVGFLYLLVARAFDHTTARLASLLYAMLPLSWFFGRAFMPEALMMALSLGGLLAMQRWLDRGGQARFVLAVVTAALCFMVKIPTLYLGFPLLGLVWQRYGWRLFSQPALWLYAVLVLAPTFAWYGHAAGLFAETGLTFGIWGRDGYDKWDRTLLTTAPFYASMLGRFVWAVATPPGFLLALAGTWLLFRQRLQAPQAAYVLWWIGALVLYLFLVPEGNRKLHYYQLPFTPVLALMMAVTLVNWLRHGPGSQRWRQGAVVAAILSITACATSVVAEYHHPENNVYEYYRSCLAAGSVLDRALPASARLVVGDLDENAAAPHRAQNPSLLYYTHRKGWQITPSQFSVDLLDLLQTRGATHFLTATQFAQQSPAFWQELLRRGVSTPGAYPRRVHTHKGWLHQARAESGENRHFIVVALGPID
ncbi:MAG: hypothetical protein HN712_05445 [Gemmatimonadetes bacterium]|jgi:4-amino-4-deoxy-L-arabinose transferase-like glycosyltransferase|nr:hypothetical protein [Gemmatimonadota bacterium]MBT6144149.1 hypothetical protein [Gemmatimonadota bacterium]MBT7859733.1 hypothetical protein [Gemmatimonadota bacterium]